MAANSFKGDHSIDWLFSFLAHWYVPELFHEVLSGGGSRLTVMPPLLDSRLKLFSKPAIFQMGYPESFYSHNLWAKIIDACLDNDVLVQRGEIVSGATKLKLNTRPVPSDPLLSYAPEPLRVQTGSQCDALYQDLDMPTNLAFEYGASECAREFTGAFGSKYLEDRAKLVILMRDQLVFIIRWTGGSSYVLRNAQTVGFLTSGMFLCS